MVGGWRHQSRFGRLSPLASALLRPGTNDRIRSRASLREVSQCLPLFLTSGFLMLSAPSPPSGFVDDGFFSDTLFEVDPQLASAIDHERSRQQSQIELIASENIVSRAVREAQGSVLTNKYAEGYPGRRYYGGCEFVDAVEALAIDRAKQLFRCPFANVQPHSGAQANQAVLLALLEPGDTILGMALAAGGHLTHGAPPSLSGKWFKALSYGVRPHDARIDFD